MTHVGVISEIAALFFMNGAINVVFPELSNPTMPTFNIYNY